MLRPDRLFQTTEADVRGSIRKWGNSLAVRLPASVVQATSLRENSPVTIEEDNGVIVIRPIEAEYELGDLVKRIKPENLHEEVEFDAPAGREAL